MNREGWIVKGEWYETIHHLALTIHIFVARGNESARNEQTRHPREASERRPTARNQPRHAIAGVDSVVQTKYVV